MNIDVAKEYYGTLTNHILRMFHDYAQACLIEEDSLPMEQKKYGMREYPDFRVHSDLIENELSKRNVPFEKVKW
jgi:hypothetical protein